MSLQHLPLDAIDEAILRRLIDAQVAEVSELEFKSSNYGQNDIPEFLADVSSFANSGGGDIVIGVAASKGIPTALSPIAGSLDDEILRLENAARDAIQPRVNLRSKAVPVSGGNVLLLRISRSFNPPHRVVRMGKGQNRFWARATNGKYEPSVAELRVLFNIGPTIAERLRQFHEEKLARVLRSKGRLPVRLLEPPYLVTHVLPFASHELKPLLDIGQVAERWHMLVPPGSRDARDHRINFDGILTGSNANSLTDRQRAYVQLYRTGQVEAAVSSLFIDPDEPSPKIPYTRLENILVHASTKYSALLAGFGIPPPYAVIASLLSANGAKLEFPDRATPLSFSLAGTEISEATLTFAEATLDAVPSDVSEACLAVRPILDHIANAGGFAQSPSFGDDGQYIGPSSGH